MVDQELKWPAFMDWFEQVKSCGLVSYEKLANFSTTLRHAENGRLFHTHDQLLTILLLGASGGGKSSLLNALAGKPVAKSHHLRPTTTHPTLYLHESVSNFRLLEYGENLHNLSASKENIVFHNVEALKNKVIIDAPDIDSYRTEHRQTVMELLPVVDLVLYVVTPLSYKDDIGWALMMTEKRRRGFAFVMNKWDAEGKPARDVTGDDVDKDFLNIIERKAGFTNPILFRVASLWWAANEDERKVLPKPAPGENFTELKTWIENGISMTEAEQLIRRKKRALWAEVLQAVKSIQLQPVDNKIVENIVRSQLRILEAELRQTVRPYIVRESLELSGNFDSDAFPKWGGPFLAITKSVLFFSRKKNEKQLRNQERISQPANLTIADLHDQFNAIVERRKDIMLGQLTDQHLNGESLNQTLQGVSDRSIDTLVQSLSDSEKLKYAKSRLWIGKTCFLIFELLLISIIVVAAWRLAGGYFSGDYLNVAFLWNFLLLGFCVPIVGIFFISVLFPSKQAVIEQHITSELNRELESSGKAITDGINEEIRRILNIHRQGLELEAVCTKNLERVNRDIRATGETEADRLFSSAS